MEYKIAVVDDVRLDSEKLQRKIYNWFTDNKKDIENTSVKCFQNGEKLLRDFEPDEFQIVFMDILMNSMNGIDVAKKIRASDEHVLIIFTTASNEYAFEAFPVHPFDYILKPYDSDRLARVLSDAVKFLEAPVPSINVKVSRSTYKIPLKNISAVSARDHFVEVVMSEGNCLLCSMSFKEIKTALKDYPQFLECNRGIIINMDFISSVTRDKDVFIMKDGTYKPIKIREHKKIIDDFIQYQISRIRRCNQ